MCSIVMQQETTVLDNLRPQHGVSHMNYKSNPSRARDWLQFHVRRGSSLSRTHVPPGFNSRARQIKLVAESRCNIVRSEILVGKVPKKKVGSRKRLKK
ncbi:hypothetical protein ACFX2A_033517 [Malus domestica]